MPRRHMDPAAAIVKYFETAPLAVADVVHGIAGEVLRGRKPKTIVKVPPKPAAVPASAVATSPIANRAAANKPVVRKPGKVALPGPGPATVGE